MSSYFNQLYKIRKYPVTYITKTYICNKKQENKVKENKVSARNNNNMKQEPNTKDTNRKTIEKTSHVTEEIGVMFRISIINTFSR